MDADEKFRNRNQTPEVIKQILAKGRLKRSVSGDTDFQISPITNQLIPRSLPIDGVSKVLIEPGFAPKEEEVNLIREKEDEDDVLGLKRWYPTFKFYVSQIVIFYQNDITYTYQVRATDKKDSGLFVLLKVEKLEQQPGVAARTNTSGGSKSSYSR